MKEHANTILRAARDMRKRARVNASAGEPTEIPPVAVAEIARFLESCGRDLNVAGRYGATDEPGAVAFAYDIARAHLGEEA